MRSTTQLSVTLPNAMAAKVKAKVESGDYASESEVIREGLRMLDARDQAQEHWLRNVAVPAAEEMRQDPSIGLSGAEVRASIDKLRDQLRSRKA